jgi:predicted DNA-binding transcriptional regulator AlpA
MIDDPEHNRLLKIPEVAELLGIGERTLLEWRKKGMGPLSVRMTQGVKPAIRYRYDDVTNWIKNLKNTEFKNKKIHNKTNEAK